MSPTRRPLLALATALVAGVALVGCGNLSEDDLVFFAGLPQKKQLEMRPAGEHVLNWNLRDEAGRPVGAGLYFARYEVEERALVRRIVALR